MVAVVEATKVVPALLGGFILITGLVSMFIKERLFLSESMLSTVFGIIIGPYVLNLVDPRLWSHPAGATLETAEVADNEFALELARFVMAISVMTAGVTLPRAYMFKQWKSLSILLLPVMFIMWVVAAAVIHLVFGLPFLDSLLIATCLTPTDPVLSNSVVKGRFAEKYVPRHVRDIISAESGVNDGLGFPYMYIALFLLRATAEGPIKEPMTIGSAIAKWFYKVWGYEILLAIAFGIVVGYVARWLLRFSESHDLIDKESFLSFAIAMTLLIIGCMTLIESDEILAVFVAGTTFGWDDWFRGETKEAHLQEVFDMLFNTSFFVYFGAVIPWEAYTNAELGITVGKLVLAAVLILFLRRPPATMLFARITPVFDGYRDALFTGWFGPVGVGAIYYDIVISEKLRHAGLTDKNTAYGYIHAIVTFTVLSSIIIHGITVPLVMLGRSGVRRVRTRTLTLTNTSIHRWLPRLKPGEQIVIRRREDTSMSASATVAGDAGNEHDLDGVYNSNEASPAEEMTEFMTTTITDGDRAVAAGSVYNDGEDEIESEKRAMPADSTSPSTITATATTTTATAGTDSSANQLQRYGTILPEQTIAWHEEVRSPAAMSPPDGNPLSSVNGDDVRTGTSTPSAYGGSQHGSRRTRLTRNVHSSRTTMRSNKNRTRRNNEQQQQQQQQQSESEKIDIESNASADVPPPASSVGDSGSNGLLSRLWRRMHAHLHSSPSARDDATSESAYEHVDARTDAADSLNDESKFEPLQLQHLQDQIEPAPAVEDHSAPEHRVISPRVRVDEDGNELVDVEDERQQRILEFHRHQMMMASAANPSSPLASLMIHSALNDGNDEGGNEGDSFAHRHQRRQSGSIGVAPVRSQTHRLPPSSSVLTSAPTTSVAAAVAQDHVDSVAVPVPYRRPSLPVGISAAARHREHIMERTRRPSRLRHEPRIGGDPVVIEIMPTPSPQMRSNAEPQIQHERRRRTSRLASITIEAVGASTETSSSHGNNGSDVESENDLHRRRRQHQQQQQQHQQQQPEHGELDAILESTK